LVSPLSDVVSERRDFAYSLRALRFFIGSERKRCADPGDLEPLHFVLSSSYHLVRVLGAVLLTRALLMTGSHSKLPSGAAIRTQTIGHAPRPKAACRAALEWPA
jgi:hypothetical protein